ncbi:hypothetical protein B0H16DRAFT_1448042 [Mycena metata]|uniref:Uncharacterized protein n=1 Tax=Mycena metata TaxID=1033252 RepID=A0AAD7K6S3_9AGAR|nr:hypothetical protein B0H16DRAFT_1448042 [Mycena metata]
MFQTVHLGSPKGPNREKPHIRFGKKVPTRCNAFLELCLENPALALYVRVLVVTESVWHPTTGSLWTGHSASLALLVYSLKNLKGFAFRTEGLTVGAPHYPSRIAAFSFILGKPDMDWIHLSYLHFGPGSNFFRTFSQAAPLRLLRISDLSIDWRHQVLEIAGFVPVKIDTLAVSFDIKRDMEKPFITIILQHRPPLFDTYHIRCLQLDVYHPAEDMDRVYARLSLLPSVEELDIRIVPGNKALHWRHRKWRRPIREHFDCSKSLHMSQLKEISFRMRDHHGVDRVAMVFARGPLAFIDAQEWGRVDAGFARAAVFPILEKVKISFGKNSFTGSELEWEDKFKAAMPKIADIVHVRST